MEQLNHDTHAEGEPTCACCQRSDGPLIQLRNLLMYCDPCAQSVGRTIGPAPTTDPRSNAR